MPTRGGDPPESPLRAEQRQAAADEVQVGSFGHGPIAWFLDVPRGMVRRPFLTQATARRLGSVSQPSELRPFAEHSSAVGALQHDPTAQDVAAALPAA